MYLVSLTKNLFPGCSPESLTPSQCRQLVTSMYKSVELVYLAGCLPEVVSRILGHLGVESREVSRGVCHTWNRLAINLRRVEEFSSITSPSEWTIHIPLHFLRACAIDPLPGSGKYIHYARSQEDFDTLWPVVTEAVWKFKRKYITPDKAQRAFILTYNGWGITRALEWALQLPYDVLCEINPRSLGESIMSILIVAKVLTHLPPEHIEPRKIVWIGHHAYPRTPSLLAEIADEMLHEHLVMKNRERYIFSLCPALGVYLYLYSPHDKWRAESAYVPQSLKSIENLPLPTPTPEEFQALCDTLHEF